MRAYASAETGERERAEQVPQTGQRPGGTDQRSYRTEVPRFLHMWADHQKRWPADRQPAADGSADPPGSYRSAGGFPLSPERRAETTDAIGRMREAEPAISADVKTTEQENRHGGWLTGFEHRVKGDDRLKEKVAEQLEAEPGKSSAEILRGIRRWCQQDLVSQGINRHLRVVEQPQDLERSRQGLRLRGGNWGSLPWW
jgi:hypothetical protein